MLLCDVLLSIDTGGGRELNSSRESSGLISSRGQHLPSFSQPQPVNRHVATTPDNLHALRGAGRLGRQGHFGRLPFAASVVVQAHRDPEYGHCPHLHAHTPHSRCLDLRRAIQWRRCGSGSFAVQCPHPIERPAASLRHPLPAGCRLCYLQVFWRCSEEGC